MKTYTTQQGDMWDAISMSEYGSTAYTGNLMMANLQLVDFYTFPAGIVLQIPDIPAVSVASVPWRSST